MCFPLALLFFLAFGRDMPTIDVTFANRDGLGTRKHALVTNHVALHYSLLQAINCGLIVFFLGISDCGGRISGFPERCATHADCRLADLQTSGL